MAKINFTDGSSSVPGQREAKKAAPGQGAPDKEAMSVFVSSQGGKRDKDAFGPNYGHQRIRFHKNDEVNPYADAEDARMAMDPRLRTVIVLFVVMVVLFVVSALLPTMIFSFTEHPHGYPPSELLSDFLASCQGFVAFLTGQVTLYSTYVWQILAALLAGCALGLSGGVYQGALKNALASPSTLGVTSGGTLGILLYAIFVYDGSYTGSVSEYSQYLESVDLLGYIGTYFGSFLCSMAGCFVIVAIIMLIAFIVGRGHVSNISLVIAGQVLASVITIVISWIRYYYVYVVGDPQVEDLITNIESSFMGIYTPLTVAVFAIPLIACMAFVFCNTSKLSLLAFKEDEARSMGISTTATRNALVAVCTVMTALVVSFTGPIGFVGFMCPHIARRLVGPEFRYLLPACAAIGGAVVVAVHCVSYMGIPGIELGSTGTFTSIIGCALFLVIALKSRGGKNAEWF